MPIYEFECLDCGDTTEILMASSETDLVVCGGCGSRNLKKLLSAHTVGSSSGSFPEGAEDRCCGAQGPPGGTCAGPGSCCGNN
jgi:putative FmdB family regulatory protein